MGLFTYIQKNCHDNAKKKYIYMINYFNGPYLGFSFFMPNKNFSSELP